MARSGQPLTKDIIDIFAPTHTILRYQEKIVCTDEERQGGFHYGFADKEWRCKRCCLLDILKDGACPEGVEITLQVRGCGNVF